MHGLIAVAALPRLPRRRNLNRFVDTVGITVIEVSYCSPATTTKNGRSSHQISRVERIYLRYRKHDPGKLLVIHHDKEHDTYMDGLALMD